MALIDKVVSLLASMDLNLSSILLLGVVFLVTVLVCRWIAHRLKYNFPPGPRGWPLIGNIGLYGPSSGQTNANITRIGRQYHPHVFTLTGFFGRKLFILNSYESIKEGFVRQSAIMSDRPQAWPFVFINETPRAVGVFLESYTESWKREKKYMLRTVRQFGYGTSGAEAAIIQEANHLVDIFKKKDGKPFDISMPVSLCFLNVTFTLIFSTTYEMDDKDYLKIVDIMLHWYLAIFDLMDVEPFLPLFDKLGVNARLQLGKKITADLLGFTQKHIDYHRATLDPDHPRDLVDACLIDMAKNDPNSDLRDFNAEKLLWMIFFFLPDQGDTAVGVFNFMMMATVLHPEVQQKVFDEIQEVIGDRSPKLKDKEKLPYTEAVVLESLRMDTAFWFLTPHCTAQDVDIFGYKIPKGTTVISNIYAAHFDPDLWDDPESFKPERFINEQGRIVRPECFIPFSAGRRSCVGEYHCQKQFFLFYATLIQKYKFKLPDGDPKPKLAAEWLFVNPPKFRLQAELRE